MPDPCVAIPHARFNHDHFHTHVQYAQTDTSHQETLINGTTGKKITILQRKLTICAIGTNEKLLSPFVNHM